MTQSVFSVFISYSRRDQQVARRLASTFQRFDLAAWIDDRIELSSEWEPDIYDNLRRSQTVLVVWSVHSVISEWVIREVDAAIEQQKLIQLNIDNAAVPLKYSKFQTATLPRWEENTLPLEIRRIVNSVAVRCGRPEPLKGYDRFLKLRISSRKLSKFMDDKKHYEGYFPKIGDTLYADFWEMMAPDNAAKSGVRPGIKLYDELRPGSRYKLTEDRYYELLEYLSEDE